ncbi:hypothetical protein [uncultured Thiodictyon sp.]|uniref:hypothetical protein n=1 Tax=uncultured Thiodictyon sp. TaxID=1846217 RepID=UPI0025F61116|nr:hypothetical protein [uncultured Thiodictyon sp.]
MPPIKHLLVNLKPRGSRPLNSDGSLALLPAGCRAENRFDAYAEMVQEFDWADFYANFQGEAYFEWMRRQLNDPRVADITLIDSRTGVTEMTGVCTRQLADVIVVLCAPNDQNLDGVGMMVRSFTRDDVREARGGRPLDVIIVPARVDVSEGHAIDRFEEQFRAKLETYMPSTLRFLGADFRRLRIPYISDYSYSERLAVGEPAGAKALLKAYALLATYIAVLAPEKTAVSDQCIEPIKAIFGSRALSEEQVPRASQLRRAREAGLIDQDTYDAALAALVAPPDNGAIAQGAGALAVGAGGVAVQGDNSGTIHLGLLIQQGTSPGASPSVLTRAYLARILTQANQLPLFVGDGANAQVRLSAVYIPLLVRRNEAEGVSDGAKPDGGKLSERSDRRLSALDVMNSESRLVLLGGPGSGKSTFVSFVALCMAGELLGVPGPNLATLTAPLPKEEGEEDGSKPQRWDHGALLPVPVVLRDFASQLPPPGAPVNAETLWRFLQGRLKQAALEDFAPVLKQRLLVPQDENPNTVSEERVVRCKLRDLLWFFRCPCFVLRLSS